MDKTLNANELRIIKQSLTGTSFILFNRYLEEREVELATEADSLSESILTILTREQKLGAAKELRILFEGFSNHVDHLLTQATAKENEN